MAANTAETTQRILSRLNERLGIADPLASWPRRPGDPRRRRHHGHTGSEAAQDQSGADPELVLRRAYHALKHGHNLQMRAFRYARGAVVRSPAMYPPPIWQTVRFTTHDGGRRETTEDGVSAGRRPRASVA